MVNYADLMMRPTARRRTAATWRSEENFKVLKDLEERNLHRAGRRQLRRPEGAARRRQVPQASTARRSSAFYLSNVEQYLNQDGIWPQLLRQRRDAAARRAQHVHPLRRAAAGGPAAAASMTYLGSMHAETRGCGTGRQPPASGVRTSR